VLAFYINLFWDAAARLSLQGKAWLRRTHSSEKAEIVTNSEEDSRSLVSGCTTFHEKTMGPRLPPGHSCNVKPDFRVDL
jgi:hypothetical protein